MNFNKELPQHKTTQAVKWEFENNKFIFLIAKFLLLFKSGSGVWYKTIWERKQWKPKLDDHTSGILYHEFSPCVWVLQQSYLCCILESNSVTTKYFFYSGGGGEKSCWDFQISLNLSSSLPSTAVFQVSVILRWFQMLWLAETPHETVEHDCLLGSRVAVLRLGFLPDLESQPCSGVFSLSKVAGEWVACSDEETCELLHCPFPGSSILAPLERADGYRPSSKWNMPWYFWLTSA